MLLFLKFIKMLLLPCQLGPNPGHRLTFSKLAHIPCQSLFLGLYFKLKSL
jgi:hypothetical protein